LVPDVNLCGSLGVVPASDVIEWLCSNRKSWKLSVLHRQVEGYIAIVDGRIVDARWGHAQGMDALVNIVGCPEGMFELVPISESVEPTLEGPWQFLLLRAVQHLDEQDRRNKSESVVALMDKGFDALRAGDATRARELWIQALAQDPDNRTLQFNLRKLNR
jgi:hypothetical protein